jgi:hypothetical protein
MNTRLLNFYNYLTYFILVLLLTSLQSSLWFQVFGSIPSPQIATIIIVYWAIYRNFIEGIIFCYLIAISTVALSAVSLNIYLLLCVSLFLTAKLIKQRVYWLGATYLMLTTFIVSTSLPFFHFFYSLAFEKNPMTDLEFLDSVLSSLLTALFALPFFFFFQKLDQVTKKELPADVGASSYE